MNMLILLVDDEPDVDPPVFERDLHFVIMVAASQT